MITDGGNWYVASSNHGQMREMASKMCCDISPSSIELFFVIHFLLFSFFSGHFVKKKHLGAFSSFCLLCSCRACQETYTLYIATSIPAPAQQLIRFYSYRWNDYETRGIIRVHPVLLHVSQCSCFVILHLIKTPIVSLYSSLRGLSLNTRLRLHGDTPATPFP